MNRAALAAAIAATLGSSFNAPDFAPPLDNNPLLTAALAESPVWLYDHKNLAGFYSDSAMTTQAVVDGPVGAVRDFSGNNHHRRQTDNAKRPTLRQTGSRYYIEYNGTSQFLVTDTIDLTGTNALTLCMGLRKVSGNNNALCVENSAAASTNNGTIRISANGGSVDCWETAIRGTTAQGQFRTTTPGYTDDVVTVRGELIVSALLNGQLAVYTDGVAATVAGAGTTGGVNYGNYPFFFGARNGASSFFSGRDYGGALYASKKTGASRTAIEAFVSDRTL